MSKENRLPIAPWVQLRTEGNRAWVIDSHGAHELTLDKLGQIAEWLAEAWEGLAGEQYKPVIISERGYVATEHGVEVTGVVYAGEHVIPKDSVELSFATALEDLERDCE